MGEFLGTTFGKLIALISIASIALLAYATMNRSKEGAIVADLSQIAMNVDTWGTAQAGAGYTNLTTALLQSATEALLPADVVPANVTVAAATANNFQIKIAIPNGASCQKIFEALGSVNTLPVGTSCATANSFTAQFN